MKLETLPLPTLKPATRPNRWRTPVMVLVVLGLAGAGWAVVQRTAGKPGAAHGDKKGPPKVEVYELGRADVATIEARELKVRLALSGSLIPHAQATVKAKVPGQVRATAVQEGMNVTAGQVLAQLDTADLDARLLQQQATQDEAQARLALARKNSSNNQALLKQNYISQSAYDTTQNSVDLAQAGVKAATAQVALARLALADSVIRAPISGIVSKRHVQAGDKVSPDMPVFTIVNLLQLNLEAQVPSSQIPRIKVGQEVQFKVDGFGERAFAGKVARINPTTEAGSRAMLVYIAVANPDGALRGGMFAKGGITTEQSKVMPLVPLLALRQENGQPVVYKIEADKVVAQPVKLGLRNEDEGLAEVTEGLGKGASVIVARLDGVKPGARVKLAGAVPATKG